MPTFYTNIHLRGNKVYVIGFADGQRFYHDEEIKPYLFIPGDGPFKTLKGTSCQKKIFSDVKAAREFIKQYENVENFSFYGLNQFQYPYINDTFPGKVNYDPSLIRVTFLDIEVDSTDSFASVQEANKEVTAITLVQKGKVITFGAKYYKSKLSNVQYVLCNDEKELLEKFLDVWESEEWKCDIISGWYIEGYDIPYLINRITRILGEKVVKRLSPWKMINERDITRTKTNSHSKDDDRTETVYEIVGISQLDYIQLYKKFTPNVRESYRLDNIAKLEIDERKLDYSEYGSLADLYNKNFELFIDYNIHDAIIVQKLDKKLGFINHILAIAYKAKINYNDAFTTIRPWDIIIHNYLMEKGIVIPQAESSGVGVRELIGAYVQDPQIGLHKNIVSFDFKGLYPSLISEFNISPETYVKNNFDIMPFEEILQKGSLEGRVIEDSHDVLLSENWSLCANKCAYSKDERGFIPELVDIFIEGRDEIKGQMIQMKKDGSLDKTKIEQLDSMQAALKIMNNGLYGAMANKHFRWFDLNLAESITTTGQLFTRWIIVRINAYLNKLLKTKDFDFSVASDTDSTYINLDPLVQKMGLTDQQKIVDFLDNVCKQKLEPLIKEVCKNLGDTLNSYNHSVAAKREIIADKGIWRAKKNYILNVLDKEGVRLKTPEVVFKGIEAVRSSTPMVCRDKIKECLRLIMQESEEALQKYIDKFYIEYMTLPIGDIAKPSSVDGMTEYYDPVLICKKGTPYHVRGAINYNELLKKHNLTKTFASIKNKDKIRIVPLKSPNPIQSHVIAFPDEGMIPKELNFDIFVDKELQWEKTFLSPIKSITEVIGWQTEKITTLDGLFD